MEEKEIKAYSDLNQAIIGRYANRINQGRVNIEGKDIQPPTNHGQHHLHGGYSSFDKRTWILKLWVNRDSN